MPQHRIFWAVMLGEDLHGEKPAGATAQPASVLFRDTAPYQPQTRKDI